WTTWYLLLGGHLPEEFAPPLQRQDPEREAVIQSLLYLARYLVGEDHNDWSSGTNTVDYMINRFMFWNNPREFIWDPNHMNLLGSSGAKFFQELQPAKQALKFDEAGIVEALDVLVARALRIPSVSLKSEPNLKAMLEKFPTSAASAKIL